MNPLSRLLEESYTGNRYNTGWHRPIARYDEAEVGQTFVPFVDEYCLRLTLTILYRANPAQKRGARANAERHLRAVLYGDMLKMIAEAQHLLASGEVDRAHAVLDSMRTYIMED